MEKVARKGKAFNDVINTAYSASNQESTLAIFEANANISRGVSYTKPRTITLDTKYDGVVAIDVWTGYAINIVSKSGKREVVLGPTTRLLDYDETIEAMELSTGRPKTTDNMLRTGFLRVENNKVADLINAQTSDFVDVQVKVSYCVNFLEEYKEKWFNVENYVKYLCDHMRSLLKREVKKYNIQEFYANSTDIVRNIVLNISEGKETVGRTFKENGMYVYDVEVLSVAIDSMVSDMLEKHQNEMIQKTLELSDAAARMDVITRLAEVDRKEAELQNNNKLYIAELEQKVKEDKLAKDQLIKDKERAAEQAVLKANEDMQTIMSAIQSAEVARVKEKNDLMIAKEKELAEIEKAKQASYAETIKKIVESISPDLIAALTTKANAQLLSDATKSMAPYAIAADESVAETVNKLMRGTSLEGVIDKIANGKG